MKIKVKENNLFIDKDRILTRLEGRWIVNPCEEGKKYSWIHKLFRYSLEQPKVFEGDEKVMVNLFRTVLREITSQHTVNLIIKRIQSRTGISVEIENDFNVVERKVGKLLRAERKSEEEILKFFEEEGLEPFDMYSFDVLYNVRRTLEGLGDVK